MTNLVGVTRLELATSSAVGSGDGLSATERTRLGNIIHEIMTNLVGVTRLELATSRPPAVCATNCATPRQLLAEGWGFEPQINITAYTRFPSVLLQPLGHPSVRGATLF